MNGSQLYRDMGPFISSAISAQPQPRVTFWVLPNADRPHHGGLWSCSSLKLNGQRFAVSWV